MGTVREQLRRAAESALQNHPDFILESDADATSVGWRVHVVRARKAYGTFFETDKLRQVQRDVVNALRSSGFKVTMGRENRDDFWLKVEPADRPKPIDLQEEVRKVLQEEDSRRIPGAQSQKPL